MSETPSDKGPKVGANRTLAGIFCLIVAAVILLGPTSWQAGAMVAMRRAFWFGGIALVTTGILRMRQEHAARGSEGAAARAQASAQASGTAATSPQASLEALIQRSDDVASTLKDLVAHGQASADYGMLPALLVRSGLMGWEGAPKFTASRLRRNRRWWISCDVSDLTDESYERLIALEGALNVAADLAERPWPAGLVPEARVVEVFSRAADLDPLDVKTDEAFASAGEKDGEWAARLALSEWLENMPAPFRVVSAFQLNLVEGLACIDVAVPAPSCFALVAPDDAGAQAAEARAYALRMALLAARGAFAASPRIGEVGVNCLRHGNNEPLLSMLVRRTELDGLLAYARNAATPELPLGDACRASVRGDGWLDVIEPLLTRSDVRVAPKSRWQPIELMEVGTSPAVRDACGAKRICDLGINEDALRISLWNATVGELGSTTTEAVGRLMALKEANAGSTDVAAACDRVSQALVEGTVDVADRQGLAKLFAAGDALCQAQGQAAALMDGEPTPDDLERALAVLDGVLVPLAQTGTYADTPTRVFRYFNSAAERVRFNKTVADGREVTLVPDAYYTCHSMTARVLTLLGRAEEGMVHIEEICRIAPVTTDAVLGRVRCLEAQERIFECADALCAAIGFAATTREMSICFYRLAYMEWRLGRNDLAIACYQRSIQLGGDVADQAAEELRDLLSSEEGLSRLPDSEVEGVLSAAGIPTGDAQGVRQAMGAAAAACVDAGLMGIARAYLGVALENDRDDAILGVYRSLAAPNPVG